MRRPPAYGPASRVYTRRHVLAQLAEEPVLLLSLVDIDPERDGHSEGNRQHEVAHEARVQNTRSEHALLQHAVLGAADWLLECNYNSRW